MGRGQVPGVWGGDPGRPDSPLALSAAEALGLENPWSPRGHLKLHRLVIVCMGWRPWVPSPSALTSQRAVRRPRAGVFCPESPHGAWSQLQVAAPAKPRWAALLGRRPLQQVQRGRADREHEPHREVGGRIGIRGQCCGPFPSVPSPLPPGAGILSHSGLTRTDGSRYSWGRDRRRRAQTSGPQCPSAPRTALSSWSHLSADPLLWALGDAEGAPVGPVTAPGRGHLPAGSHGPWLSLSRRHADP